MTWSCLTEVPQKIINKVPGRNFCTDKVSHVRQDYEMATPANMVSLKKICLAPEMSDFK